MTGPVQTTSQTVPPSGEGSRFLELDGLRGVAILLVAVMHSYFVPEMVAGRQITEGDIRYANIASIGWAGVDLFFVLSGFLITGILLRTREHPGYLKNFFARRALRILPLYYAVVLWHLFVLPGAGFTMWEKVAYLTYWPNFWQAANPTICGHDPGLVATWSLAIEEQFYLVWPFLVLWLSRRQLMALAAATVVGALCVRLWLTAHDAHWWAVYAMTPCRLDTLAIGALLALVRPRPGMLARLVVVGAFAGVIGVGYAQGHWRPEGTKMHSYGFSLTAILAGGLLVLATGRGITAAFCRQGWLRTYGKYSYAIYLVHVQVMEWLVPWCFGPAALLPLHRIADVTGMLWTSSLAFVLICCAVFLLAGWLSWNLFERHILALKRFFADR